MKEKSPTSEELLQEQLKKKDAEIKKLKQKFFRSNLPFWILFAAFLTVSALVFFN